MTRHRRVLYAPRNISGQASEYVEAIRPFGFDGEVWSFGEPVFGFTVDRIIDPDRLLADPRYRWELFDAAVRAFDVFHFQFGRSLLKPEGVVMPELWDLPLLKSLGKKVFMHFRGSDVRLKSMHLEREPHSYFRDADIPCDEDAILGRVATARRFCDALFVSTPGLLDYVPDAVWIPHTLDVEAWRGPSRSEPDIPVVVHAPSSRATKGSDYIDPVLRSLDGEGVIRYQPIDDVGRDRVKEMFRAADVVVDSLTIGDHGLVSVEAMAAGCVAVAHIHPRNRARNPGVPVVEAEVPTLERVIRDLAGDPARRVRLREESWAWVAANHDRSVVGAMLADNYSAPLVHPDLPYPDWPRSDSRHHVEKLEEEVERLRADIHPVLAGAGWSRGVPASVARRLAERISVLEEEVRRLAPESPLVVDSETGRVPTTDVSWRDRLKEQPRLHLLARRIRRRLQGLR